MKEKTPSQKTLLFPAADTGWEVWSLEPGGARHLRTENEPDVPRQSLLAVPVRELFAVPLWLSTIDRGVMREMIFMQLERRGIVSSRGGETVFDYRVITQHGSRTLVLAIALPGAFATQLEAEFGGYTPSAYHMELPADALTLWREQGRLVVAVTKGNDPVYLQSLGSGELTPAILRELRCVRLQLESEHIVSQLAGIRLWGAFTPEEATRIANTTGLSVEVEARRAPLMKKEGEAPSPDVTPHLVRVAREAAAKRAWWMRVGGAVAGVYALILSVLLLGVGWNWIQAARLEAGLKKDREQVAAIRSVSDRWERLAPVVDSDAYPMELLLRCSSRLPGQGVRFTLFTTSPGRLLIQGEAGSPSAAANYAETLKHSGDLHNYKIDAPAQPVLPNGNAKFQIEGTKYGTN